MRPEHCLLAEGTGLPAEVVVVEPTGADTQLYCRFNGQELNSLVRDRVSCRAGDRITFESLLHKALAVDPDARPEWRLQNLIVQKRARWLLSRAEDLFVR